MHANGGWVSKPSDQKRNFQNDVWRGLSYRESCAGYAIVSGMASVRWPLSLLLLAQASIAAPPLAIQQYLTHPGFEWKCERAEHFEFCLEASLESDVYLAAARNSAEPARTRILQTFGAADYKPRVYVFFVESPERMQQLIGYHGEGRARPTQHAIFFVPTRSAPT
jgi:hypothetical protein